jgi:hypothetical protein
MEGYTIELGELQQKILKHIFECTSKSENVSHISKSLSLAQPTVFKSVQSLLQEIENHYKSHPDIQNLQFFKRIFKTPEKRDFMIKKAMEYAFKNDYFDEGSTIRQLSEEELKKFRLYMTIEYINSLGSTGNISTLKEFIDRYELDRDFMKEYLNRQKQFADLLLKELDK